MRDGPRHPVRWILEVYLMNTSEHASWISNSVCSARYNSTSRQYLIAFRENTFNQGWLVHNSMHDRRIVSYVMGITFCKTGIVTCTIDTQEHTWWIHDISEKHVVSCVISHNTLHDGNTMASGGYAVADVMYHNIMSRATHNRVHIANVIPTSYQNACVNTQ